MEWIKKRRRGIGTAIGLAGAAYWGFSYIKDKLVVWQQDAAETQASVDHLRQRVSQAQENATLTTAALAPELSRQIDGHFNIEQLTAELRQHKQQDASQNDHESTPETTRSKADIWEDIKTVSFTRALTALYAFSLLHLLTAVQISILGRHAYVDFLQHQAATNPILQEQQDQEQEPQGSVSQPCELSFLTITWWLLHRGWKPLADQIAAATNIVISPLNLKDSLSPQELQGALLKIRYLVEAGVGPASSQNFRSTLLPTTSQDAQLLAKEADLPHLSSDESQQLQTLKDELLDIVEADDFCVLQKKILDQAFLQLANRLEPHFTSSTSQSEGEASAPIRPSIRLVNLLPVLSRELPIMLASNPNEYLQSLDSVSELRALSSIIMSMQDVR